MIRRELRVCVCASVRKTMALERVEFACVYIVKIVVGSLCKCVNKPKRINKLFPRVCAQHQNIRAIHLLHLRGATNEQESLNLHFRSEMIFGVFAVLQVAHKRICNTIRRELL